MALARVYARGSVGVEAPLVTVEVHLSPGMPGFTLVGLPETVVRESRERVRSALLFSGFKIPARRITVNLAPAELPKGGGRYDLAIAIGLLAASGQLTLRGQVLDDYELLGELSLSGELRPVTGLLPGLMAAEVAGRRMLVPRANHREALLVGTRTTRLANTLLEICAFLCSDSALPMAMECESAPSLQMTEIKDMSDVQGQPQACRALLVAAAGRHNLLMKGPPGTGKTMLAERLPGLLPRLRRQEALELACVRSIAGDTSELAHWRVPPFRAPHHTASAVALVGGGLRLQPGEISLAHRGVLFLDELPEFSQRVLDVLRQPLESGEIVVARASYKVTLPARFQLLAAMNPCPCGYHGDPERECRCSVERVKRYQETLSGPLLDRIDMHVEVARLSPRERQALTSGQWQVGPDSETLRAQVAACRQRQYQRQGCLNAELDDRGVRVYLNLSASARLLLAEAMTRMALSVRATLRLMKVAGTLADLADKAEVGDEELLEALAYRSSL